MTDIIQRAIDHLLKEGWDDDAKAVDALRDRAEAQASEIECLREALVYARAGMKVWADDVARNLKPYAESIAATASIVDRALKQKR